MVILSLIMEYINWELFLWLWERITSINAENLFSMIYLHFNPKTHWMYGVCVSGKGDKDKRLPQQKVLKI